MPRPANLEHLSRLCESVASEALECRELAAQLGEAIEALGRGSGATHAIAVGGLDATAQASSLRRRPPIVVATPGRLADLLTGAGALLQASCLAAGSL